MTKKYLTIVETTKRSFNPSDFDCSVGKIIEEMQSLVDEYGDSVYLEYDYDCGEMMGFGNVSSGEYSVKYVRQETDKERNKRLDQRRKDRKKKEEAKAEAVRKKYELYQKLKREFDERNNSHE